MFEIDQNQNEYFLKFKWRDIPFLKEHNLVMLRYKLIIGLNFEIKNINKYEQEVGNLN